MSACESTWDYVEALRARVCRQCGASVSADDMRDKGKMQAIRDRAKSCAMTSALAAMHRQRTVAPFGLQIKGGY